MPVTRRVDPAGGRGPYGARPFPVGAVIRPLRVVEDVAAVGAQEGGEREHGVRALPVLPLGEHGVGRGALERGGGHEPGADEDGRRVAPAGVGEVGGAGHRGSVPCGEGGACAGACIVKCG